MIDFQPASWTDLVSLLARGDTAPWVFRGQQDFEWQLATRLERDLSTWPRGLDQNAKEDAEVEAIHMFISKARPKLPTIAEDDLLAWLSVMQHYGAPTRLLDWTRSPFVACYFAFAGGENDAALWMLNEVGCRLAHGSDDVSEGTVRFKVFRDPERSQSNIAPTDEGWRRQRECLVAAQLNREEWPLPVAAPIYDERIRAQQGLFTFHGSLCGLTKPCPTVHLWAAPKDLDGSLKRAGVIKEVQWRSRLESGSGGFIRKIRLKAEWRRQALRALQAMNITPDVLFPGLDGVGRAATLQVQYGDAIGRQLDHNAFMQQVAAMYSDGEAASPSSEEAGGG